MHLIRNTQNENDYNYMNLVGLKNRHENMKYTFLESKVRVLCLHMYIYSKNIVFGVSMDILLISNVHWHWRLSTAQYIFSEMCFFIFYIWLMPLYTSFVIWCIAFTQFQKYKKYMRLTKYLIHLQLHKTSFSSSLDFLEWYIFLTYDPRLPLLTNFLRTKKCSKEKP